MANYYELLEVSQTASAAEIKRAYRIAVKKYHPDLHPNVTPEQKKDFEAKTKEINEAYAVLSDAGKRAEYDLSLRTHGDGYSRSNGGYSGQGGYGAWDDFFKSGGTSYGGYSGRRQSGQNYSGSYGSYSSFDDIFEDFFGQQGYPSGGQHQGGSTHRQSGGGRRGSDGYGGYSHEDMENMRRAWEQYQQQKNRYGGQTDDNAGWDDFFGSGKKNKYWRIFTSDPFRSHSSSLLLGILLGAMLSPRLRNMTILLGIVFLLIFGRWIFYFLIFYLIFRVVTWAVKAVATRNY